MEPISIAALGIALVSFGLAGLAYWRSGGRRGVEALRAELVREVEALRMRQRVLSEEISLRLRTGYEDLLTRVGRAQERLVELRQEVAADVRQNIDALTAQLAEIREEADEGLARLRTEVSTRAEARQEALQRRVRRLEGRVQLLMARAQMVRAERLAERGDFVAASGLLEDAVARVREVKLRLFDPFEEDPTFANVLGALQDATRSLRVQAEERKSQIERALAANDSLLAQLEAREQVIV